MTDGDAHVVDVAEKNPALSIPVKVGKGQYCSLNNPDPLGKVDTVVTRH
jgi:hypothetical protein